MGDPRRFHLFAQLIAEEFGHDKSVRIADVAGGKGYLQIALREFGFTNIVTFDTRFESKRASHSLCYRHKWFNHETADRDFNLVIGMHPDEGTDQIIKYADRYHVPFVVCPCCVKPSAVIYQGSHSSYETWMSHLQTLSPKQRIVRQEMKMIGRRSVLIGR